jgi:hypothetical protein
VAPRSVFLQWSLLLREGERVLGDLAAYTEINTIELSNFCLEWGESRVPGRAEGPSPLALPPQADFGGLPVPLADQELFRSLAEVMELIRAKGFEIACNLAPLYVSPGGLAQLACVDVTGARVPGIHPRLAVYACPSNPATVAYGEAMAREFVAGWPALDVLTVNHAEYPFWPQAGLRELFVCFCDSCRVRAESLDLDFGRMRQEALALYSQLTAPHGRRRSLEPRLSPADVLTVLLERPFLADWLSFRLGTMSEFVQRVTGAARDAARVAGDGIRIGLEFQLPALARLVGTDFVGLGAFFDWLTPKFPDYLAGSVIPVVADEIAAKTRAWEVPAVRRTLRELLDLGPGPEEYEAIAQPAEGLLYSNTFDPSIIERQRRFLDALDGGRPLYPYIWLYDHDLEGLKRKLATIRANGFEGSFLWCWDRDLTTESVAALAGAL